MSISNGNAEEMKTQKRTCREWADYFFGDPELHRGDGDAELFEDKHLFDTRLATAEAFVDALNSVPRECNFISIVLKDRKEEFKRLEGLLDDSNDGEEVGPDDSTESTQDEFREWERLDGERERELFGTGTGFEVTESEALTEDLK